MHLSYFIGYILPLISRNINSTNQNLGIGQKRIYFLLKF